MQTAGMLRGTRAIYFLVLLAPLIIDYAHSYPYQLLPSIPGYIPVYIRNGDQPLEEINPALAEAFHEHSSLSKSIRLDRNLGHLGLTDDGRTNSVIDASKKQYYPAHAREPENAIVSNDRQQEEETRVEKSPGHQVPKLVSLYELHEKLKKKTQQDERSRTSSVSKESPAKINPISSLEKENFDKDETKPNDVYDPNPNYPELPADIGHHRDTSQDFASVIGLDALTEQPNVRQYKDLSHLTDERNTVDDKNEKKEEEPVKVQRPSDILSNVEKLLPIAPPEAYMTEKSKENSEIKPESQTESKPESKIESKTEIAGTQQPPVLYYKDLSYLSEDHKIIEPSDKKEKEAGKKEENSKDVPEDVVLKETGDEDIPSNVFKLSPIAPPEAYEPQEKSTKDKIEEEKPIDTSVDHELIDTSIDHVLIDTSVDHMLIDTSVDHEPIDQPMVQLYKDPSHLSDDQEGAKMSSTATKEENEPPVKEGSPLDIPANVIKLLPIAPPEAYLKGDKDAASSTTLLQGIVQDDEKKDLTNRNDDVST